MHPHARRPDNRQPLARANHRIRAVTVRCVGANGEMLGVMPTREALRLAQEHGLDLVEIAPTAEPPVCRIMDFGKYRYEESLKKRRARAQAMAHNKPVKEMKFHANVEEHDYQTKVRHMREFLQDGHKVKVTLQFRGRENAHRELGLEVVKRVLKDCEDVGVVEMEPRMIGRMLVALLGVRSGKSQPKKLDTPRPVGYSPAPTLASKTGAAAGTPAGTSAGVQVGGPGAAPSETAAGAPAAAPAAVPAGAGVENPGASQPC